MKNLFCLFFLSLCAVGTLSAQDYSISGSVENTDGEPIPYVNVQLLSAADSTLVDGASSDENGRFEIGGVKKGSYLLKASYIENESELIPVEVEGDVSLGTVRLSDGAQVLDEVVVTSQKPRLERKVDRLVFNIENTALADSDIWSVLKRTPSVIIVNDRLTVRGSGSVGILINGRKVNLPKGDIIDLLSGTSASDVEAIEVITSPPAKYSAEDAILINIRKNKNLVAGYNGAVYNRYKQVILPKHTVGTDHYFKGEKAQFSVNYSFSHDRNVIKYTDITNFIEDSEITSTWSAEQEYLERRKKHNVSAFFDYDLNEKNRLSLSAIAIAQPKVDRRYTTETAIVGDTLSGFNTLNDSDEQNLNTSFYLDYVHELDKEGAEISMNGHYTYYDYERGQDLNTVFLDATGSPSGREAFTTDADQRIDLFSAQADFATPLGEMGNFGTGLRYAGIASQSDIVQQGFDRDQPGIDPTESGNFDYDESIYAGYASYGAKWEKWELTSGLRAEYTETTGISNLENQSRTNNYLELFPSFAVNYTSSENHDYTLYYNRNIKRPRYAQINPFQVFQSNFSTIEGNPALLPQLNDYVAGGYTYKNTYTIELFYRYDKNHLEDLIFQDNDTKFLRFISSNLEYKQVFGADLIFNKEITDFWYCYLLASFYQDEHVFKNLGGNETARNQQFAWFVQTSNSFSFLEDRSLTADLYLSYRGPQFVGNARYDGFGFLNLSFRKTFWNNMASITLGVDDIFNQGNQFNTRNYLDQNGSSLLRAENRLFTLGLRYKFGNTKIRDNYKNKSVDERDRL